MAKANIIDRLREQADNNAGLRSELTVQQLLHEAAAEIARLVKLLDDVPCESYDVMTDTPECPHCGCEFAGHLPAQGTRYPPVFQKHACECGYTFESERVVRYISRPLEERK